MDAEQLTVVRASLDPSGYVQGAAKIVDANQKIGASGDAVVQTTTKTTRALVDGGSAFDRYVQRSDAVYAAQQRFNQVQAAGQRAYAAGRTDLDTLTNTLGFYSAQIDKARQASDSHSFATRNLAIQTTQFFSSLQAGQPVVTAAIQQGHQLVDSTLASGQGFGSLATAARSMVSVIGGFLLSPLGIAVTAIAAFGAAAYAVGSRVSELADEQRTLATAITATGRSADVSSQALQTYIGRLRDAGVASSDAAAMVSQLARDQNLSQSQIGTIAGLTPDLAAALGVTNQQALDQLKSVADGSADAVQKLNDALHILSPAQEAAATAAEKHGDKAKALQIVVDGLTPRITGLAEQGLSPAAEATRNLTSEWNNLMDAVARSTPVQATLQAFANAFANIAHSLSGPTISDLTANLAQLQGQAMSLQHDLDTVNQRGMGRTTTASDVQHQLSIVQQQIATTQARIDALTKPFGAPANSNIPAFTTTVPGAATASAADQAALDAARSAQSVVASSPAGQIATLQKQIADFQAQREKLDRSTADGAKLWDTYTAAIAADNKAIEAAQGKQSPWAESLQKASAQLDTQITAQKALTAAYQQGQDAVNRVMAQQAAEKQLIESGLKPATAGYAKALEDLTQKELLLIQTKSADDFAKQIKDTNDATSAQLAINAAYDGTQASLDRATNYQRALAQAVKDFGADAPQHVQDYADALDRGTAAAQALKQAQASVQAVADVLGTAFDRLGQGLVNAFLSGQGAAVSFGNVMRSVASSILSDFAQLALINPIENALLGTSKGTLGIALSTLGNSGSGGTSDTSSGGGSLFNSASNILQIGGLSEKLGLTNIGESLGLTGPNGIFSGITRLLATPIFGADSLFGGASIASTAAGLTPAGAGLGAFDAAGIGAANAAGLSVSLGNALGGIGAGFGHAHNDNDAQEIAA